MTRFGGIALGSVAPIASVALLINLIAARHASSDHVSVVPPACTLLTATDASTLGGFSAAADTSGDMSTGNSCVYKRTGSPDLDLDVVEIASRTYADARSAHAGYPKWANPFLRPNPAMTWIPLTGVGDEATLVHVHSQPGTAEISFRHGSVNVKISVYPPPSDSALATAARTMVSRM
jgi:hypothetical protein